ncbi:MAG: transposase [Planctomycetales bacterium]
MAGMLGGTVEIDEANVGGKPRNTRLGKRGRGSKKVPVVVLVERGRQSIATPLDAVDGWLLPSKARRGSL